MERVRNNYDFCKKYHSRRDYFQSRNSVAANDFKQTCSSKEVNNLEEVLSAEQNSCSAFSNDFEDISGQIDDNALGENSEEHDEEKHEMFHAAETSTTTCANANESSTSSKLPGNCEEITNKYCFLHPLTRQDSLICIERAEKRVDTTEKRSTLSFCDICGKSTTNKNTLKNHIRNCHKDICEQRRLQRLEEQSKFTGYQCPSCPQIFLTQHYLKAHVLKHHVTDPTTSEPSTSHIVTQANPNTKTLFSCKKCNFTCFSEQKHIYHFNQHELVDDVVTISSENKYSCNLCHEILPDIEKVSLHVLERHKDELGIEYEEKSKKRMRIGRLTLEDVVTSKSDTEFSCNFCSKIFSTLKNCCKHARAGHRKELGFAVCANSRSSWKPYKCPHCETCFVSPSKVKLHVKRVHDKVRDIHCEICGAGFTYPRSLKHHTLAFHSEKRDYEICDICGKPAASKQGLQNHKKRCHESKSEIETERLKSGPVPISCVHCVLKVPHVTSLKKHMLESHAELYDHQCSSCPRKFIQMCGLLAHQKKKHYTS